MRLRALAKTLSLAACAAFALPTAALAKQVSDGGEGLAGEIDDRFITFFSFGVMVFFVLVITLMSIAQRLLERRKEQRHAGALRRRIGW